MKKHLTFDGKQQIRTALVIGNGNYAISQWKLENPKNDAAGIARMLQSVGFYVYVALDGSGDAIIDCAAKAVKENSELSVLYYSGHGIQREYNNYLVATDLEDIETSKNSLVSLDELVLQMRAQTQSLIVF